MPRVAVIITPTTKLLPGQKMKELLKTLGLAPRTSFSQRRSEIRRNIQDRQRVPRRRPAKYTPSAN